MIVTAYNTRAIDAVKKRWIVKDPGANWASMRPRDSMPGQLNLHGNARIARLLETPIHSQFLWS